MGYEGLWGGVSLTKAGAMVGAAEQGGVEARPAARERPYG
jgi:hypothetical protein